jgi:hypothetical protein
MESRDSDAHLNTEALALLQALATQSADVQKVLAFEGAFDRLFAILQTENGVDGGAISREVLLALDLLLRFNSSNQVCCSCTNTCA